MSLEFIASQIIASFTAKTVPVISEFLSDRVKKILESVGAGSGRDQKKVEELRKEIEGLKKLIESKEKEGATQTVAEDVKEKIGQIDALQKNQNLDIISDEAFQRWTLKYLNDKLSRIKQAKSTFKIDVWTEKGTRSSPRDISVVPTLIGDYKMGDNITLFFRSNRDCYLTLFNIGTSGKLTVLFPNSLFEDNFIRAGQIYAIPGEGYPFEYKLSGPPGVEMVKAIATTSKIDSMDLDFSGEAEFFYSTKSAVAVRDISVVAKKLEEVPPGAWAEATCEFKVR